MLPGMLLMLFFIRVSVKAQEGDAETIVKKIDDLYRSKTSAGRMEMEIITPHWSRTLKMDVWTEGMEKTFIRILEPKKERGMATLRISSEMWNYLPKANKVMKIPPSMMMGSWMGSDFTNDDLVKEFSIFEDYDYSPVEVDDPEPGLLYVKCVPHEDLPIVWGHILIAVREKDSIPVWEKYYDEKSELMREIVFKDIKDFDGREIPSVMELTPLNKTGHKTIIRYQSIRFDITLDKDIFTLRNLRKRI
ncbi:MAG: outer membrane lipoprotein-sorting protein [Candidatus Aminicenantes bacterium]|nr:outer membrane lipoprotein-sorting protein [Candidatus Aminicenantes bacterium]